MRLIVLCLVLAIASPVSAETFDIAGRTVAIELPTGFCPLDRDHPMDREIFAVTEDVNTTARYLFHAAPCQSLEDWHEGRALAVDRYMNAVTPLFEGEPKGLGGMTRSRFLWEMKQTLPTLDLDEVQAEVDEMYSGKDIAVGGIQMLGVIAEDENALYVALASTVETAQGENVVATLWATTALNSAIVFVYLTTDMAPGIHETLAAELAPYMAELVRQNP
jgi:hypothetical protein